MKTRKKVAAMISAVVTGVMLLVTGCGNNDGGELKNELTYWVYMNSNSSGVISNLGETMLAKKLEENTGIKVMYQHPPVGQENEKFNIMIASDELPDIIEHSWMNYPGGPQKAIDEKIIISLNDYKDKAPNLFKYFESDADVLKQSQTDSGDVFAFPFVRGDESLCVFQGIVIRQDWLDDLGLDMPETIDEWENVLTQFKEKKGAVAPLSIRLSDFQQGFFCGAYGVTTRYYRDGDTVKYGPAEPGFKEFLIKMNDWYEKKLLDNNFAVLDSKTVDSNILNGVSGATVGAIGSGIGKWMSGKVSEKFKLEGAAIPVLKKGDIPQFGQKQLIVPGVSAAAITAGSKNIDAALKFLDYGYGEEGHMLYNFGIEGESYNMIDGYPKYTDIVVNNPDGLSMTAAMVKYMRTQDRGPFVQDKRYMEQYAALPEQKRAWETWQNTNMSEHSLTHIYITSEEQSDYASLGASVKTYTEEMMLKFIMGKEPFENYDRFVEELNQRGLKRVLEIQQNAYNRYLKRGES